MGKDPGPDRNRSYRDTRGSPKKPMNISGANFAEGRQDRKPFHRLHNRLVVAIKMIDENLAKQIAVNTLLRPSARPLARLSTRPVARPL